jgi:hypothetical protein
MEPGLTEIGDFIMFIISKLQGVYENFELTR